MKIASGLLSLVWWGFSAVLWSQYASTRPSHKSVEDGRIYPLNTHGSIVYLNSGEAFWLYFLMALGVLCFLVAGVCYLFERKHPMGTGASS